MSSFPPATSSSDPSTSPPAALPLTATATATASTSRPAELFPPTLISPAVAAALPPGYTMRPLRASDHGAGFLDVLRVLTAVGDVGAAAWRKRFDEMCSARGTYYVLVVCDAGGARAGGGGGEGEGEGRIVGTGAVVVERKFIRGLGCVGHIEDIAVARDQQGMKLGLRIIEALDWLAAEVGCYKVRVGSLPFLLPLLFSFARSSEFLSLSPLASPTAPASRPCPFCRAQRRAHAECDASG